MPRTTVNVLPCTPYPFRTDDVLKFTAAIVSAYQRLRSLFSTRKTKSNEKSNYPGKHNLATVKRKELCRSEQQTSLRDRSRTIETLAKQNCCPCFFSSFFFSLLRERKRGTPCTHGFPFRGYAFVQNETGACRFWDGHPWRRTTWSICQFRSTLEMRERADGRRANKGAWRLFVVFALWKHGESRDVNQNTKTAICAGGRIATKSRTSSARYFVLSCFCFQALVHA